MRSEGGADESHSSTVTLRFDFPATATAPARTEKIKVDAKDALMAADSEHCRLEAWQAEPPTEIVSMLAVRRREANSFGPTVWSISEHAKKLSDALVTEGRLSAMVEGHGLHWIVGRQALLDWAFCNLLGLEKFQLNFFKSLFTVSDTYVHSANDPVVSKAPLAEDVQAKHRLINPRKLPVDDLPTLTYWNRLSQSQYTFVGELATLRDQLVATLRAAIKQGRIIGAVANGGFCQLIAADQVLAAFDGKDALEHYRFLPSAQLSAHWLENLLVTQRNRKELEVKNAIGLLKAVYELAAARDQKVLKDFAIQQLIECTNCSQQSAQDAWKAADIPRWKEPGVPDATKILSRNFRDLNNGGELFWQPQGFFD